MMLKVIDEQAGNLWVKFNCEEECGGGDRGVEHMLNHVSQFARRVAVGHGIAPFRL